MTTPMTANGPKGDPDRRKDSIKVLLVDDEPPSRSLLKHLVETQGGVTVVAECGDGLAALQAIEKYAPDIVMLDINMPRMNGLELLSQHPERVPYTIIVTAVREHALKAFDLEVTDYLLKPVSVSRLQRALGRARRAIERQRLSTLAETIISMTRPEAAEPEPLPQAPQPLLLRKGTEIKSIPLQQIVWLESANQYLKIHTVSDTFVQSGSLSAFARRLDRSKFVQISRSAIVNADYALAVRKGRNGVHILDLRDGKRLNVARSRAAEAVRIAELIGEKAP
ncbi:MAG: LytTR family DNA-binding domain-containing protein [Pseudomonadota bacterium]